MLRGQWRRRFLLLLPADPHHAVLYDSRVLLLLPRDLERAAAPGEWWRALMTACVPASCVAWPAATFATPTSLTAMPSTAGRAVQRKYLSAWHTVRCLYRILLLHS